MKEEEPKGEKNRRREENNRKVEKISKLIPIPYYRRKMKMNRCIKVKKSHKANEE